MPCCETTLDERSAGNLHATFCGSRRRVTASGHPVLGGAIPQGHPAISLFRTVRSPPSADRGSDRGARIGCRDASSTHITSRVIGGGAG